MRFSILVMMTLLLIQTSNAFGGWSEPQLLLKGNWGAAPGEFGIYTSESDIHPPDNFCISPSGYTVVGDDQNLRVQVFKQDGTLRSSFGPVNTQDQDWKKGWPLDLKCFSDKICASYNETQQFYTFDGKVITTPSFKGKIQKVFEDDTFLTYDGEKYYKYSSTFALASEYAEQNAPESVKVTPENIVLKSEDLLLRAPSAQVENYARKGSTVFVATLQSSDTGSYYAVSAYDKCGKSRGYLELPQATAGSDDNDELPVDQFTSPLISPSGDVYAARIAETYSILRWPWTDDLNAASLPDAPVDIKLTATNAGMTIKWLASPQDPGCVTGYEISRSEGINTDYRLLTQVKSGAPRGIYKVPDLSAKPGVIYYYKVRAVSGAEYSSYTQELRGSR